MFSFSNIILGLIGFTGGIATIYYAFFLNHKVFFLDFVERRFGGGTGTTAYRVAGLLMCIFSMLVMIGRIDLAQDPYGNTASQTNSSQTITTPQAPTSSLLGQ